MTEIDLKAEAKRLLEGILERMEIPATVEVAEIDGGVRLQIASEEAGRLIGRKGQTLESLEMILNRMVRHSDDVGQRMPWISLDVDGYHVDAPHSAGSSSNERHGRLPSDEVERLQAMAKDIAREVKKLRKSRVIGPFSPSERRIIHLALENDEEVETISDAEADANRGKRITVQLKAED